MTSSEQWRYVAIEDNPADFVSRGMDSPKLKTCELWWNGPKFLMSNQYPQRQIPVAVIKDPEEEIVTREEYRDKFIIWKIRAERYVESVSNTAIQNSVENQPQNITLPLNSTVSSILTNQPRLPKLTLESFSGKDISSFPSFWARFNSAVHENSSLNDVDKFSYLKSVVTSDAELAIRGLTLTSENYAKAIKILENRFGRKERIADFHMNRLLNLTPVRKSFDVIALRNLYDQLEINIKGLESLEISPDSYSCLLFPIIMKAIPPDLAH
ncbi:DUF1758 domain-containing protein [Trichonephila clavipes]|nr:DUF1758 domain-containing protein [Trichonephila clavipes]